MRDHASGQPAGPGRRATMNHPPTAPASPAAPPGRWWRAGLLLGAAGLGVAAGAQVIVYDNQTAIAGGPFVYLGHGGAEHGDELELKAGTPRQFDCVSIADSYSGVEGGTAVVRLYELDGIPVGGFNTPGTKLLDSGPLPLSAGLGSLLVGSPAELVLPDTVAFSVQFDLPDGTQAGLIVAGDAVTGFSFNDEIWQRGGGGWFIFQDPFLINGQVYGNFAASMAAVPEPRGAALVAGLLLAGWAARRHRASRRCQAALEPLPPGRPGGGPSSSAPHPLV